MNPSQQLMVSNVSAGTPPGQDVITAIGTTSWVAPDGVTSVSVVVVSLAYNAMGGALSYKNNITVVPGNSYTVTNPASAGYPYPRSSFINDSTVSAGAITHRTGDGGGDGRNPGGAGGYSGDGGLANWADYSGGQAGTGGGGGGGAYGDSGPPWPTAVAGIGGSGGVGLLGEGPSGAGGVGGGSSGYPGGGGGGGSGGVPGTTMPPGSGSAPGGNYGGGYGFTVGPPRLMGIGAVRIIWPGDERSFPSTRTADE